MAKLIINDQETDLEDNSPIQESCENEGVPFGCTEGVCGTCIVEVSEGMENLTKYTQEEEDFLGPLDNERMACQCKIKEGVVKLQY